MFKNVIKKVDQVELYNAIHRVYSLDKNEVKVVEIAVYTAQEFQEAVSRLKKKIANNDVVYVYRPIDRDTGEVQKGSVTFNGRD